MSTDNEGGYTLADIHRLVPSTRRIPADKMFPPDFVGADGQRAKVKA